MPSWKSATKEQQSKELTRLFQDYSSDMLTYAHYKLGGRYDDMAEDIVQEAFTSLWKNIGILQKVKPEDQKRFLLSVVKCRVIDFLRKKTDIQKFSTDDEKSFIQLPDSAPSTEALAEGKELYYEICSAIQRLDDTYRCVMEMKYIFHLSEKEMARILDISEKNVSVRVFRGRKMLQEILQEQFINLTH